MEDVINRILKAEQEAKEILFQAKKEQKQMIKEAKEQREIIHKQMIKEAEQKANHIINDANERTKKILETGLSCSDDCFSYEEQRLPLIVNDVFRQIWGISGD